MNSELYISEIRKLKDENKVLMDKISIYIYIYIGTII